MNLSRIASIRSQANQLIPNVKPHKAKVTEIGMILYTPWWNTPLRIVRGLLAVEVLVLMAVFLGYLYVASWLIRLLLGVRPELQLVWPERIEETAPETTEQATRLTKWRTVAGKKVFGEFVDMDDLADTEEPF